MILANTKERLLHYLDSKQISKPTFYSQTGIKRGLLDVDKMKSAISDTSIAKIIAAYPDLNLEWLVTGRGQMLISSKEVLYNIKRSKVLELNDKPIPYTTEKQALQSTENIIELQTIPLYELGSSAGLKNLLTNPKDQTPLNYLAIPNLPPCDGALYVRGDNMYPLLKSGDIVLYKRVENMEYLIWGEMYIISFRCENEAYVGVKYINKIENDPDHVLLANYNPNHAPMRIPLTAIQALAIIKASVRYNTMG